MTERENETKTLYINKYPDRVEIVLDKDLNEYLLLYPHPFDSKYFVVEKYENEFKWAKKIPYSELNLNDNDFCSLVVGLFINTEKYLKKFINKSFDIGYIVVDKDLIEVNEAGLCQFSYGSEKLVSGIGSYVNLGIYKFDDRFEIKVFNENKTESVTYKIRQHPLIKNRFIIESDDGTRKELGFDAENLCELFKKALTNPKPVVEKVLNEKVFILEIMIEGFSLSNKLGFGNCNVVKDFDITVLDKIIGDYSTIFKMSTLSGTDWTLVIENYDFNKIKLYIKGDPEKRSWTITPYIRDNSLFVLSFEWYGIEVVSVIRKYYNYRSGDIIQLYRNIIAEPSLMLKELTNLEVSIKNV
ncbi:MAG: hypothetical protein JHC26_04435, partial [Thermofilum sp.]|uniref:hypothetical protein n=1 Tax=Thermofilum sp. TaxID=1961369 RepID=UPI00258E3E79